METDVRLCHDLPNNATCLHKIDHRVSILETHDGKGKLFFFYNSTLIHLFKYFVIKLMNFLFLRARLIGQVLEQFLKESMPPKMLGMMRIQML